MAELYLYAGNTGSYEKGDVVDVLEDDAYGGSAAKMPSFFVVRVPGTKSDLVYLKEPISHEEGEERTTDKKRKYNCDYVSVIGQERIVEILSSSEWLVDSISLNDITEKVI